MPYLEDLTHYSGSTYRQPNVFCSGAKWGDEPWRTLGNGEVHVRDAAGTWFVAPRLIGHYVEEHNYLPPQDFIDTVINPFEIGTTRELRK